MKVNEDSIKVSPPFVNIFPLKTESHTAWNDMRKNIFLGGELIKLLSLDTKSSYSEIEHSFGDFFFFDINEKLPSEQP